MFKKLNIEYLRWTIRALKYRFKVEKHEIHFMLQNLKEGKSTIDIGAHKGAYTYWMSKYVGEMGQVFAFEPQPLLYKKLKNLINLTIMKTIQFIQKRILSLFIRKLKNKRKFLPISKIIQ